MIPMFTVIGIIAFLLLGTIAIAHIHNRIATDWLLYNAEEPFLEIVEIL